MPTRLSTTQDSVTATPTSNFHHLVDHYTQLLEQQAKQWEQLQEKHLQQLAEYRAEAENLLHKNGRTFTSFAPFRTHYSAFHTFTSGQICGFFLLLISLVTGMFFFHIAFFAFILAIVMLLYLIDMSFSCYLSLRGLRTTTGEQIDDTLVHALAHANWPTYTILCPLYREAAVAPQLVRAMQRLDYPPDKLQILILTQNDDTETLLALQREPLPSRFQILTVPDGNPRTKPRACNYGLLHATGEYVVIFDAEDIPEPLQLKKAILTFLNHSPQVACVQAKLSIYNSQQNLMTRWFANDYSLWFDMTLPGLQTIGLPIPLGGTSNHFRRSVLYEVGGWDAFNVTEDCDLGLRLAHYHYKTVMVNATTYEEANAHIMNWLHQRSRWIKGYMQTYLVNTRQPWRYLLPHLWTQFFSLQFLVGAKTAFLLINPFMWIMLWSYLFFHAQLAPLYHILFPTPVLYISSLSLIFGNFFSIYANILTCLRHHRYDFIKWTLISPFYWLAMSIASYIALFELIVRPHFWSKTQHGLHLQIPAEINESSITPNTEKHNYTYTIEISNENIPTLKLLPLSNSNTSDTIENAILYKHENTPTLKLPPLPHSTSSGSTENATLYKHENTPTLKLPPLPHSTSSGSTENATLYKHENTPTLKLPQLSPSRSSHLRHRDRVRSAQLHASYPPHVVAVFHHVDQEITIRTQENTRHFAKSFRLRDPWLWGIGLVAVIAGLLSIAYFLQQNMLLTYMDANSHALISRRIFDNMTPGLAQLGGVWLPLPHLIMLPFIWNDYLWHSGLAGAFAAFPCYVLASLYLYLSLKQITHNHLASFIGTLLFTLNPNILYLQATPLSEILLIATITIACYHFLVWSRDEHFFHLIMTALGVFLATLTRYDGWFLFIVMLMGIIVISLLRKHPWKLIEGKLLAFGSLGGLGILLWIVWCWVIFGNPLFFQSGAFSSQADQSFLIQHHHLSTFHNIFQSLFTFSLASLANIGMLTSILAVCGLLLFLLRWRFSPEHISCLIFITPFLFYIISLYLGQATIFIQGTSLYDVRYGAEAVVPAAFFVGLLLARLSESGQRRYGYSQAKQMMMSILDSLTLFLRHAPLPIRRTILSIVVLAIILGQGAWMFQNGIITVQAGIYGADCSPTSNIVRFMTTHYTGGNVLLDFYITRGSGINFVNVPQKNIIYEGNGTIWQQALRNPSSLAEWVVANPYNSDDMVAQKLKVSSSAFLSQYIALAQEPDGTLLFHHKEAAALPTNTLDEVTPKPNTQCWHDIRHPRAIAGSRTTFMTGVVYPHEGATAYGPEDPGWIYGMDQVKQQTGAHWIDIPLSFSQDNVFSSKVRTDQLTPTPSAFAYGVHAAHQKGYKVFVSPLLFTAPLNKNEDTEHWAGSIRFTSQAAMAHWFASYWQALQPYIDAAQREGVEQFSLGTEIEWLANNAPAALWNTLIENAAHHYSGTLVYNINWDAVQKEPPQWFFNPALAMIGVSAYFPLLEKPARLDANTLYSLWKVKARKPLDQLALKLHKTLFLSEMGFTNRYSTSYATWNSKIVGRPDPEEQALAFDAALRNISDDPHIAGVFVWGWDNVSTFDLHDMAAAATLHIWYTAL